MAEARFIQPRGKSGRGNAGSFAGFEQRITDLMKKEADQFLGEVSDTIRQRIGHGSRQWAVQRRRESTGRLQQVTRNPNNRIADKSVWRAGIKSYLDNSDAKYARTIEFGSEAVWAKLFRGTPLLFRPEGFKGGRNFRSFKNGRPKSNSFRVDGMSVVRVQNEIQPQYAYRDTFKNNGWPERIKRDFRLVLRDLF